jgi:hypothetical protein
MKQQKCAAPAPVLVALSGASTQPRAELAYATGFFACRRLLMTMQFGYHDMASLLHVQLVLL